jgi:hypothetical protein
MEARMDPSTNGGAAPGSTGLPQFYRRPAVVSADRHAGKSLADAGYGFARDASSMAVNAVEFGLAGRSYPIVFMPGDAAIPVAVLGLRSHENLFVDAAGRWRPDCYVPAYARRYPFLFATDQASDRLTLCIDEAAPHLVDGDANPLYADGKPTKAADAALGFCAAFQGDHQKTIAFAQAIAASGLLVDNQAEIRLADGRQMRVDGYRVVDQEKFSALPDATIVDWHRRGWLGAVHAHLLSMASWQNLATLAAAASRPN